jgi:hypothetical protein
MVRVTFGLLLPTAVREAQHLHGFLRDGVLFRTMIADMSLLVPRSSWLAHVLYLMKQDCDCTCLAESVGCSLV